MHCTTEIRHHLLVGVDKCPPTLKLNPYKYHCVIVNKTASIQISTYSFYLGRLLASGSWLFMKSSQYWSGSSWMNPWSVSSATIENALTFWRYSNPVPPVPQIHRTLYVRDQYLSPLFWLIYWSSVREYIPNYLKIIKLHLKTSLGMST